MGLTQVQFAERIGVSSITIHRWESGQSRPRRLALARLRELEGELAEQDAPGESRATSASAATPPLDFAGNPEGISAVVEALRLAYGHQFNPAFASETARIDPLPHQRIAVYERMLGQDPPPLPAGGRRGSGLRRRLQDARAQLPDAVRQAYSVVVTVNERNDVHAFRLAPGTGPLFATIKNDERARIKETPVDAEALLPDGPYDYVASASCEPPIHRYSLHDDTRTNEATSLIAGTARRALLTHPLSPLDRPRTPIPGGASCPTRSGTPRRMHHGSSGDPDSAERVSSMWRRNDGIGQWHIKAPPSCSTPA